MKEEFCNKQRQNWYPFSDGICSSVHNFNEGNFRFGEELSITKGVKKIHVQKVLLTDNEQLLILRAGNKVNLFS